MLLIMERFFKLTWPLVLENLFYFISQFVATTPFRCYIETALISQIAQCDMACGCVAWLTNENILKALGKVQTSLIVQKEDFLRPDINYTSELQRFMRSLIA